MFTTEQKEVVQNFFNKSVDLVIKQGSPARAGFGGGSCFYRLPGSNGVTKKCAIGHMLTDDQIAKYRIPEGASVRSFTSALIQELLPGVPDVPARDFLIQLQGAHDTAPWNKKEQDQAFISDFHFHSNSVAVTFGLESVPLPSVNG